MKNITTGGNMEQNKLIKEDNHKVFSYLSYYLNQAPDYVTKEKIAELTAYGVSTEYAFAAILTAAFGLDIADNKVDKQLFNHYFCRMFQHLDASVYYDNPYYKYIKIPTVKVGNSELKYEQYKAFEGFVCDDIIQTREGRQIAQIGFFNKPFKFPAVLENDRIWMTITPNEIETMKEAVAGASGKVLTYGLGLGYYAYMVSKKEDVDSITIVDKNEDVIRLFKTHILPQFPHADKVRIVKADAFDYAKNQMPKENYDFVFTDLWHDVSDGIDLYLKMKKYEKFCTNSVFSYWIEKSILCYL